MVFSKGIDVDLILFAIKYFVKYKQGKLKYPGGIAYIVQDRDVVSAWEKEKQMRINEEIRKQQKTIVVNDEFKLDLPESSFEYKPQKARSFADILR